MVREVPGRRRDNLEGIVRVAVVLEYEEHLCYELRGDSILHDRFCDLDFPPSPVVGVKLRRNALDAACYICVGGR